MSAARSFGVPVGVPAALLPQHTPSLLGALTASQAHSQRWRLERLSLCWMMRREKTRVTWSWQLTRCLQPTPSNAVTAWQLGGLLSRLLRCSDCAASWRFTISSGLLQMTTKAMAFFVEHTSGVVCVAMEGEALDRLALPLMVPSRENEEALYTAFTVTVDARKGISTGISAADRALTVRLLADPGSCAQDFRRPGHLFPLRYRPGGVLARPGHTEAAVDLSRLAGCQPAGGVLCCVNSQLRALACKCSHLVAAQACCARW